MTRKVDSLVPPANTHWRAACGLAVLAATCYPPPVYSDSELFEKTIEELGQLRVTSVSRRSEPLGQSSGSIYLITAEDIRRSGFSSIPEVLRLAPGVEVARENAHSWTVSVRGFNNDLSNKLLVLIDGRSVYSPLYAGVFWDAQDTLLQDIERIEVVSGPGGTLWGANAVNGVINIITRSAEETQGSLVELGAGDEEQATVGIRHGWSIAEDIAARAYLKYSEHDASRTALGAEGVDDGRTVRSGFRVDWEHGDRTRVTLQGDVYGSELGTLVRDDFTLGTLPGPDTPGDVDISGHNLLGRWEHQLENDATLQVQTYYDHTSRDIPGVVKERRDTLDIDLQHQLRLANRHHIVWGAVFRVTSDALDNTLLASFVPDERTDTTWGVFFQDEIALLDDQLFLTVGSKLEKNDYTDFEVQPNLRASWAISEDQLLWAAISRAVRVPSRLDTDLEFTIPSNAPGPFPFYLTVIGNDSFRSEELIASELGYRVGPAQNLSLDLSVFYNQYDHLETLEVGDVIMVGDPPAYLIQPATLGNGMEGDTYGGSLVANWQPMAAWRLQFQYAYLDFDLELKSGSTDTGALSTAGRSPGHQAAIHSFLQLPHDFNLYTGIRYTDELTSFDIRRRTAVDISLGWRPIEVLRVSFTVRNLNHETHLEYGGGNLIERSAYLRAVWTF